MRARHRLETDRITREKEQEMEQLHQRYTKPIENSPNMYRPTHFIPFPGLSSLVDMTLD